MHWGSNANTEATRIFDVLIEFYWDWVNGIAWQPTPGFIWDHLQRDLTESEVNDMMLSLQEEFEYELTSHHSFRDMGYEKAFPFTELDDDSKRALAQRIVLQFAPFVPAPKHSEVEGW